jgi:nucleotide-binding universal stress UspA family protein
LAVPATARELPHDAVAAIDFSAASLRAARAARDILARPSTLHLVHVCHPPAEDSGEIAGLSAVYAEGVALQLERLVSELALEEVKVVSRVETGPLTQKLLEVVHEVNAGLIACGTTSLNAIERVLLGHVPLELLRRAECSVLIAPRA